MLMTKAIPEVIGTMPRLMVDGAGIRLSALDSADLVVSMILIVSTALAVLIISMAGAPSIINLPRIAVLRRWPGDLVAGHISAVARISVAVFTVEADRILVEVV